MVYTQGSPADSAELRESGILTSLSCQELELLECVLVLHICLGGAMSSYVSRPNGRLHSAPKDAPLANGNGMQNLK